MSLAAGLPLDGRIHRQSVVVAGGPLAVLEVPGDGPAVVLLPGFTGSKEDFREILTPLAAGGRRVLAYDQRGQYQSPGPDDPAGYTVDALAADLLGLQQGLHLPAVHLVGHSFGGLVARRAVLLRPAIARSLTLLGSGPQALTGPRVEVLPLLAPVLAQGGLPALVEATDALGASDPRNLALPAAIRQFLRDRMLASAPAGLLGMATALTTEPDRVPELRATGVPTLVLHGQNDDAWTPSVQADMAQQLGARYEVVPEAAHSPAVENPAATARLMRAFFDNVERGVCGGFPD